MKWKDEKENSESESGDESAGEATALGWMEDK